MTPQAFDPVDLAFRRAPWFRPGDTVLAAVSGGPDSMAMLEALCAFVDACAPPSARLRVVAAHFDHGLRAEAAGDRALVEACSDARGVEVVCGAGDVPARARVERESIEAAARRLRYSFLFEAAGRVGAAWIATAHTRSDQVETVLMRVLRGAGLRGLRGIPERRGAVVRPLLGVSRADTVAYCVAHGVPFVHDATNDDRRFFRNAVRHDVLPSLRRAFPTIDEVLLRMARSAGLALETIRRETDPRIARNLSHEGDGLWALDARAFDGLDEDEAAVLVCDVLAEHIGGSTDVCRAHVERLVAMGRGHSGCSIDLPGLAVRREHDALVFRHAEPNGAAAGGGQRAPTRARLLVRMRGRRARSGLLADRTRGGDRFADIPAEPLALAVPGTTRVGQWVVSAGVVSGQEARESLSRPRAANGAFVAYLALDALELPLVARAPRPGDRLRPLGMSGHKKVSDVFIDCKIPLRRRARSLVVEDGAEIRWVVGAATSESARVRESSARAVRLEVAASAGRTA